MQNPIKTKITDLKFSLQRIQTECQQQGFALTCELLDEARMVLEKAIASADRPNQEPQDNDDVK